MNPRYRRLLIPGLLLLLLLVVLFSSLTQRADGAEVGPVVVSQMTDPRIGESSGLALSRTHDDLAYTINDSGNDPLVFAVQVSTGQVVGVTRVEGGQLRDTEALALDGDGTLWVADTGDNFNRRRDIALYALPEPGPGDHTVTARRYAIAYPKGRPDVEALLIDPSTGTKFLVSKDSSAIVYALPKLHTEGVNVATVESTGGPALITDATFSADGRSAAFRSYAAIFVVDPDDWSVQQTLAAPPQKQGETIASEQPGTVLVGSEGQGSSLIRVTLPTPDAGPTPGPQPVPDVHQPIAPLLYVVGAVAVGGVVGLGIAIATRRNRSRVT